MVVVTRPQGGRDDRSGRGFASCSQGMAAIASRPGYDRSLILTVVVRWQ